MTRKHLHYAVDLDGTLAEYHGWKGTDHIGDPIPAMVERVKAILANGDFVTIFTARMAGSDYILGQAANALDNLTDGPDCSKYNRIAENIEAWCLEHIGQVLPITAVKLPYFHTFLDDRAEQIIHNDGRDAALEYHRLAYRMLEVMKSAGLDPIVLINEFDELNSKVFPVKEIETP